MTAQGTLLQRMRRKIADDVLPRFKLTTYNRLARAGAALDQTSAELARKSREYDEISTLLSAVASERDHLVGAVQRLQAEAASLRRQTSEQAADLRRLTIQRDSLQESLRQVEAAQAAARVAHQPDADAVPLPEMLAAAAQVPHQDTLSQFLATLTPTDVDRETDDLYFALETSLRGPETLISQRQSRYLEHLPFTHPELPVVDLGCGRGEFLELLRSRDISAVGVDSSARNVEHAGAKGLAVHHGDAADYLRGLAPDSLAAVTAFEVAEHLPHAALRGILRLAYQKIAPGGFILLETANPYCLEGFRTYYLDPTHQHPIPPDLLAILVQFYGFRDLRFFYQNPIVRQINAASQPKSRDFYLTYAVLGVKPHA